jgi:hypothetical protein
MDGSEGAKYEIISLKRLQKPKINSQMKLEEFKWAK